MARRPHVRSTQARREALLNAAPAADRWPTIPENLLVFLEDLFVPRCMTPGEELAAHMVFAGKVELVELLRAQYDLQSIISEDDIEEAIGVEP